MAGKSGAAQLDDILAILESRAKQAKEQKVIVSSKVCEACGTSVQGEFVNAFGKSFHAKCFVCAECKKPLGGATFFNHEDKPYCEEDYNKFFGEVCARCAKPCASFWRAAGLTWHKECFQCEKCHKLLHDTTFFEKGSVAYCTQCYAEEFNPRCSKCGKPIIENAVRLAGDNDSTYHLECLVCSMCGKEIGHGRYYRKDDDFVCKECGDKGTPA